MIKERVHVMKMEYLEFLLSYCQVECSFKDIASSLLVSVSVTLCLVYNHIIRFASFSFHVGSVCICLSSKSSSKFLNAQKL